MTQERFKYVEALKQIPCEQEWLIQLVDEVENHVVISYQVKSWTRKLTIDQNNLQNRKHKKVSFKIIKRFKKSLLATHLLRTAQRRKSSISHCPCVELVWIFCFH